jgi:CheY-like chemotaxis protein
VQGRQGVDRRQGGLGLGLSIVRNLVQRHGGSVAADSAGPGQGSELTVRLPWVELERTSVGQTSPEGLASRPVIGTRVLLVDDNEDAANLLASALSDRGCDVQVAHDAVAALRLASEQAFDVALLDIGLPVMDGYELAGRLRQLQHLARASLIAVTGYGQAGDRQRALDSGFHEHLVKPVDFGMLERIIAQARADAGNVS